MASNNVQYVTGADGNLVGVFIPIDQWRDMKARSEIDDHMSTEVKAASPKITDHNAANISTLEEAGIEISERTGLPVFRVPRNGRPITLEDVRMLEDEW